MLQPVYFEDRVCYIADIIEDVKTNANAIHKRSDEKALSEFIQIFHANSDIRKALIYGFKNIQEFIKFFKQNFLFIEASGGLVTNKNSFLFIFRNGKWDLPKGKREKGESVKDNALREVREECGFKFLDIECKLTDTYHTYFLRDNIVLKKTSWFKMYSEQKSLQPQTEEGIWDIKWFDKSDLGVVLNNTYPSVLDVLKEI